MQSTAQSIAAMFLILAGSSCSGYLGSPPQARTTVNQTPGTAIATFAGGCFWCMESPFEKIDGVYRVTSGYTGGEESSPTYEQVSAGATGHAEAVEISYDPLRVSYLELLDVFWKNVNPTDAGGQFVDRGNQYRPAIFYHTLEQKRLADASAAALGSSGIFNKPLATAIVRASAFYAAEQYHQDFYLKNPTRYHQYRDGSGRDAFIITTWGNRIWNAGALSLTAFVKAPDSLLRGLLTPRQYEVTQRDGTEPPFSNEYVDNHSDGIFVDIVSGEPLFSSQDKFESGTGWPSFTKPLVVANVVLKMDASHGTTRTEVRSKSGNSHLGHVFDDGPPPTGKRYCMNSASLLFVPAAMLGRSGYAMYSSLFAR